MREEVSPDGAAVGCENGGDDGDAADGEAIDALAAGDHVVGSLSGERDSDVRARGQEDEEGEAVQGVVREREAEEGEEDREDQGSGRGPQVHPLAPPLQAHLVIIMKCYTI